MMTSNARRPMVRKGVSSMPAKKMPGATLSPRMVSGRKPAKKMMVQKMGRKR